MENVYFKVGDKVKVISSGHNASEFTSMNPSLSIRGIYSLPSWRDIIFTIGGMYESIAFENSPETYGAYPLLFNDKPVGFVYNDALVLVEAKESSSLIGKKYLPFDNSYSVNLTSSTRNENIRRYLGGTYNTERKECIIISEPFTCSVLSIFENSQEKSMIIVNYQGESHMVLYSEDHIIK